MQQRSDTEYRLLERYVVFVHYVLVTRALNVCVPMSTRFVTGFGSGAEWKAWMLFINGIKKNLSRDNVLDDALHDRLRKTPPKEDEGRLDGTHAHQRRVCAQVRRGERKGGPGVLDRGHHHAAVGGRWRVAAPSRRLRRRRRSDAPAGDGASPPTPSRPPSPHARRRR